MVNAPRATFQEIRRLIRPGEQRLRTLTQMHEEKGDTFLAKLPLFPVGSFLTRDADLTRHVLVDNAANYVKSQTYRELKPLLGNGLLTSEGPFWRSQRKIIQPAFHRPQLARFADTIVELTDQQLARWTNGTTVNVAAEASALTLRVIGQTLFSIDLERDAGDVGPALLDVLRHVDYRINEIFKFPAWVPTPGRQRAQRALGKLDDVVSGIISSRRDVAGQHDLVDTLLAARDESGASLSPRQIRDEVMTLVLAGHETTSSALAWTWHLLARHPQVRERVEAEVAEILQDRPPRFEDYPRLAYTTRVLEESLRLYPPIWAVERQALAADRLGDIVIPAGHIVSVVLYTLHRNPRYWEAPNEFDPDRFLPERTTQRHRGAYAPFAAGPRQCLGNHFAMMEGTLILARAAQKVRLDLVPEHALVMEPSVTLRPSGGLPMRVVSRSL